MKLLKCAKKHNYIHRFIHIFIRRLIRKSIKAVTLVELLVAMALLVLIVAAIVPQFRAIRNSMASNEASSTIIQNGRVLEEHINRNLSAAYLPRCVLI
jgi:Tfp pilus assembly protein PilW